MSSNSIGGHRVLGELGQGGMARVYRVLHEGSGRELALKQLHVENEEQRKQYSVLFEREFRTLAQLRHPRVIEVYDYGVADAGAYYTMELLDGGDLRSRSPLPWRAACELLFDVCSSLALLHSRRLVHRDVTPRNVRCTTTGSAKLIDFGAMAPMGPSRQVVGTPAFVAPEVVYRSALDGRTDLYSLGATFYYALTGRVPYPARQLSEMLEAWGKRPPAPSLIVPDIPEELDRLVMEMLSIEPALRPRGAYEVMQRLRALAGIEREEPASVSAAYLATPVLVGREEPLFAFRGQLQRTLRGHGGGVLVGAQPGLGRSRLLDAVALEARLLGATPLRVNANGDQRGNFAVARGLAEQLIEAHPESALRCARALDALGTVFEATAADRTAEPDSDSDSDSRRPRLALRAFAAERAAQLVQQTVLAHWFLRVSRQHALLIAIDDVDYADQPSLAMLAALAERTRQHSLLLAITAERLAFTDVPALEVLASHCTKLPLRALDRAETEALLTSVFGDVPNLTLLSERIHAVAAGRPRECMALLRQLIERGLIAYTAGSWTLPQQLALTDLPSRVEEVLAARVSALSPRARRLAQLQSLSIFETFAHEDFVALCSDAGVAQVDAALSELLSADVLQASGASYRLHHRGMRDALQAGLEESERSAMHAALAELYLQTGRPVAGTVSHLFSAGQAGRALDLLGPALENTDEPKTLETVSTLSCEQLALLLERALDACEHLQRSRRERSELTRWLFLFSLVTEDRFHARTAPALLAQLEHDSGLCAWRALDQVAEPMPRLMQALQRAGEQYAATPEPDRVYRVDEAIRHLVYYVAISIAVGARTLNGDLLALLAPLLEPFAPLTPVLHVMWQNAIAPYELSIGKLEQAHARWLALYEQLAKIKPEDLQGLDLFRNAIAFALGSVDAQLGRDSVGRWAALLDADLLQQVNAMYLRRTLCLHRGDFESAERFRRKAEVLSVQATVRQMFTNTLMVELAINALVGDLTGVKQVGDRIAPLAAQHPGWRPYHSLALVHFHHLRGDLHAAAAESEQALAAIAPDGKIASSQLLQWLSLAAAYLQVLFDLERYVEAKAVGDRALCESGEATAIGINHEIGRALALIEAKLGDLTGAAARLDAVIEAQRGYNGPGLALGASYEARARIAIWAGDHGAVEHYGQLAAHEYRHGRASALGARYEQLLREARSAGIPALLPQLTSFASTHVGTTALGGGRATVASTVTSALKGGDDADERAAIALRLLCEAHAARGGHLYVMRESGLVLTASLGADVPDQGLQPFLGSLWQRHLIEPELPTALLPEGTPQPVSTADLWTDGSGKLYQPVLISGAIDGVSMHVGIAALIPGSGTDRHPHATQVTATIASYLIGAGDVRGIEA